MFHSYSWKRQRDVIFWIQPLRSRHTNAKETSQSKDDVVTIYEDVFSIGIAKPDVAVPI